MKRWRWAAGLLVLGLLLLLPAAAARADRVVTMRDGRIS